MRVAGGIAKILCPVLALAGAALWGAAGLAGEAGNDYTDTLSFSDLGGVGLLQTRTARFLPDGEVALGLSYTDPLANYFLTWQATPWLELTARYSDARNQPGDLDRALDLKFRLVRENGLLPAVAVGFQDALGNGPYSGEYFAFSKHSGPVDVTFGLSWGYPASRGGIGNPFGHFFHSFKERTANRDHTGVPAFGNFFSGRKMGVFGGVEYRTSVPGLTVKLEYNGGDARTLTLEKPITRDFPLNAGVNYRPFPWINLAAGFERGDTVSLGLSLRTNLHDFTGAATRRETPPPVKVKPRERPAPGRADSAEDNLPAVMVPPPAGSVDANADDAGQLIASLTRALYDAGIGNTMVELKGSEADVTLSVPPEEAATKTLRAAYLALSNLPARYQAVRIRNRDGETVGREGQLFTRRTVETLARVDAAFDDLLRAGGVAGVTVDGRALSVQMTPRQGGPLSDSTVAAAADLLPDAKTIEIRNALGRTERRNAGSLHEIRTRDHLAQYLQQQGFALDSLAVDDGRYTIGVHAEGRFGDKALARAVDGARAILSADGKPATHVTLTVMRGGLEVAHAERPEPPNTKPVEAAAESEDSSVPDGMRYSPLFGLVRATGGDADKAFAERQARPRHHPRPVPSTTTLTKGEAKQLKKAVEAQGLRPLGWRIAGDTAEVAVANDIFDKPATAIGRAARALTATVPGDVDWLGVTTVAQNAPLSGVRVLRRDVDYALAYKGSPEEIWLNTDIQPGAPLDRDRGWTRFSGVYPHFSFAVYPEVKQHFGNGADGGYKAEGFLTVAGDLELFRGLTLSGAFSRDLGGNLDTVPPGPGVTTPRVRSDIARYTAEGRNAISRALATYVFSPATDVYVRASAGLYETMFGGGGLEALYRPEHSHYAVGVDVNWVKQRGFDQLLDFRGYHAWTGEVSLYRDWPGLGLESVLSVGRYLAGDWGGTLNVYRRFGNGIRLGAWVTLTNMPRDEFGRDSFAKGLYLSIPIDLILPWSLNRDMTLEARPLNRDGGQQLDRGRSLYELTRPGTQRAIKSSWPDLLQ